jgi:phosphatidate cytidylyltransferase
MLRYRIISGCLIGAAIILTALYMPAIGIFLILVAVSTLGQLEFYNLLAKANIPSFRILGTLSGIALIAATFFTMGRGGGGLAAAYNWENLVLMVTLIAVFCRQFPQKNNPKPLETIGCTLLGVWYVPYLFNFFSRLCFAWNGTHDGDLLRLSDTGRSLCLFLLVAVKFGDIGAYTTGRLIGRHKLFPRISPGKTWEGFFGGIVFSVVASLIFCRYGGWRIGEVPITVTHAMVLGALLSVVGVVGDMFESLLKRAAGAKDSSALVPGMGGILDLVDSLLFGAPVCYIYVKVFLL